MLHHPFTDVKDLLLMDGDLYDSYSTAFAACQQKHHFHPPDYIDDPEDEDEDAASDALSDDEDDYNNLSQPLEDEDPADYELWARRQPRHDDLIVQEDLDDLGSRTFDHMYDWTQHVGRYAVQDTFWEDLKLQTLDKQ